jgi:hypothetical protein
VRMSLARGHAVGEITSTLRKDFGTRAHPVWANNIEIDLPKRLPAAWLNDETLRGDFLQAVSEQLAVAPGGTNSHTDYADDFAVGIHSAPPRLTIDDLPADLAAQLDWSPEQLGDPLVWQSLLAEVGWLGADLLGPAHDAVGGSL